MSGNVKPRKPDSKHHTEHFHQLKKRERKIPEGGKRVFVTPSLAEMQQCILSSVCNAVSQMCQCCALTLTVNGVLTKVIASQISETPKAKSKATL